MTTDLAKLIPAFQKVTKPTDELEIILNQPVSGASLASLVAELALVGDKSFFEYLALADGEATSSEGMFEGERLLSSSEIISAWHWCRDELIDEQDDGQYFGKCPFVKQGMCWRQAWLPIVFGHAQTMVFIDTDPAQAGVCGQILLSAQIVGDCGVIASDVTDLFQRTAGFAEKTMLLHYPFIDPNTGIEIEGANSLLS